MGGCRCARGDVGRQARPDEGDTVAPAGRFVHTAPRAGLAAPRSGPLSARPGAGRRRRASSWEERGPSPGSRTRASGRITSRRMPPRFMPGIPWFHPLMTSLPPSRNWNGSPSPVVSTIVPFGQIPDVAQRHQAGPPGSEAVALLQVLHIEAGGRALHGGQVHAQLRRERDLLGLARARRRGGRPGAPGDQQRRRDPDRALHAPSRSNTILPPTIVSTTLTSFSSPGSTSKGFRSSTARSARNPGSTRPSSSSIIPTHALFTV